MIVLMLQGSQNVTSEESRWEQVILLWSTRTRCQYYNKSRFGRKQGLLVSGVESTLFYNHASIYDLAILDIKVAETNGFL